jgi:hypothetical protein
LVSESGLAMVLASVWELAWAMGSASVWELALVMVWV